MATPTIDGTHLTIAVLNDAWQTAGTNIGMVADTLTGSDTSRTAQKATVTRADVVMIQEGKRAKYADVVNPAAYDVHQDTSSKALAGSALVYRKAAPLKLTKAGWLFLVKALGILARYLAWGRFDVTAGGAKGRQLLLGSAHRPPKRAASWWKPFDAALALRCRRAKRSGRLVIIGMDANQVEPERLAKMCGLVWHSVKGRVIDGFLASPQIQFVEISELPKNTSDHHPLVATVVVPAPKPKRTKMQWPPAFEHVIYNGRLMDQKTKAFVQVAEKRLGYPLTILQGCYNPGGVSASAGTHDGGGVLDLAPWDVERKNRVVRSLGGFGWHRLPSQGPWGEHYHFGIRDHGRLSPAAAAQQRDYDGKPPRNGLATHLVDMTWHPSPPVDFTYPPKG